LRRVLFCMKPDQIKEGMRWLLQAEQDLDDAKYVFRGKRFHLACFLAQQAAEKALKAFLYANGETRVFGHSVAELCRRAISYDKEFEKVKKVSVLDKYQDIQMDCREESLMRFSMKLMLRGRLNWLRKWSNS